MSREIIVGMVDGGNLRTKNQTSFKGKRDIKIPEMFLTDLEADAIVLLMVTEAAMVDMRMVFERSEHMLVLRAIDGFSVANLNWVKTINRTNWLDYAITACPGITRVAWDNNAMNLQPDLQGYQTIGDIPNVTVVGRADDQLHH